MRRVDLPSGSRIEYVEIGQGAPIVYLHGAGGVPPNAAFMPALAEHYHVFAPSRPSAAAREDAAAMVEFVREVVGRPVHLVAESAGGAAGCWLAILEPTLVRSLILVAPTAFAATPVDGDTDLLERLGEIAAPTLVLWGTADEILPPEAGHAYVQRIPTSFRILVYGATHSLPVAACDQFVSLATDFIERGERFVVAERG